MKIHLWADFDGPQVGGGGIKAEIGSFKPMAGASVFDVIYPVPDQGVLRISENQTGSEARLLAELTSPVDAAVAHVSFLLTPVATFGDLIVVLAEDGESGMIDIKFDPGGRVRVGSNSRLLPGMPGDTIEVRVELRRSLFGQKSYTLELQGPLGIEEMSGPLGFGHGDLGTVEFRHPGSTNDGSWYVDDLLVTSSAPKNFKLFGGLLDLSQ
ncbi:MAG: hypothetical protein DHS20C15_10020 [Planctomycetota bacterium]|nr:MAG: hypothetical protein DHS20C15_10020 [Planctomycetota bacterium]